MASESHISASISAITQSVEYVSRMQSATSQWVLGVPCFLHLVDEFAWSTALDKLTDRTPCRVVPPSGRRGRLLQRSVTVAV